jgi:hypothetical protein
VKVLYTASFGKRDPRVPYKWMDVESVLSSLSGWTRVSIVDQEGLPPVHGWERMYFPFASWDSEFGPRRGARFVKCLPHLLFPASECSIWLDDKADESIFENSFARRAKGLDALVTLLLKGHDMAVRKHPFCNTIADELRAIANANKENPKLLEAEQHKMRQADQTHWPTVSSGFLIRKHTDAVARFGHLWWQSLCKGSSRDQLYFHAAALAAEVSYRRFDLGEEP